jgi:UrcA family protein
MSISIRQRVVESSAGIALALCLSASAALLLVMPGTSQASERDEVRSEIVRFADLSMNSTQGATTLYARLSRAAKNVCTDREDVFAVYEHEGIHECEDDALQAAVGSLARPQLTAVFEREHAGKVAAMQMIRASMPLAAFVLVPSPALEAAMVAHLHELATKSVAAVG